MLKIWEKDTLLCSARHHLGPIYSICSHDTSIITAGAEGVLRKFEYDKKSNNLSLTEEFDIHEDSIWDIKLS